MNEEEQYFIRVKHLNFLYNKVLQGSFNLSYKWVEKMMTEKLKKKVSYIKQIVNAYNYDESNSMVDYFNKGFYWDIELKKIA